MKLQPVVLCGGSGTRLWPLSREQHPKQLLCLTGTQWSLLQETVRRLDGLMDGPGSTPSPVVLCNEQHRFVVAEQLRAAGIPPRSIILEPAARGTAPALTLAALHVLADGDPVLAVMPSDHAISSRDALHEAFRRGAAIADDGHLVTFGIAPASPATGYGYIRAGDELQPGRTPHAYDIVSFIEKPDHEAAQRYCTGPYLWNSGIFMVRGSVWIDAVERLRPEILAACELAHVQGARDGDFYRVHSHAFEDCPHDSIDYAVMEHMGSQRKRNGMPCAAVVRLESDWCDVGAWDALWRFAAKDGDGNVRQGDVCAVETRDSLLIAEHRLLACVGVEELVVIETADAVMVARRDRAQDVKKVVSRLKSEDRAECLTHRKVHRPWGSYDGIDKGERFQVKRIIVNPGAALSLQMHFHRAEHWIVVRGTARVTRGEETFLLGENQSTYIPVGVRHRLENPGRVPLEIIEVQSGSYLGEDDIVRFEDAYGRTGGEAAAGADTAVNAPRAARAAVFGAASGKQDESATRSNA